MGSKEYGQVHSATVVLDPHTTSPEERFKCLYTHYWENSDEDYGHRIACAYSGDGIQWKVQPQEPIMGSCGARLGDVSVMYYDENAREFIQNTRHIKQTSGVRNPRNPRNHKSFNKPYEPHNFASFGERRIWQSRSHDFVHWSEPILILACDDEEDNLDEAFYGMAQSKVGPVHLATVGLLHKVENTMDVHLMFSRDGLRWHRTDKRQPFLAPRGEGNWDAYMVSMVSPPILMGDDLWFFHGGADHHHDWSMAGPREGLDHPETKNPKDAMFGLGLATLRKDGYAGLKANHLREGVVVTRFLRETGNELIINGKCEKGGSIHVEIVDVEDNPIDYCTKENCDPLTSDSVNYKVTWKGNQAIPNKRDIGYYPDTNSFDVGRSPDGNAVKLRFYIKGAELFSFQFTDLLAVSEKGFSQSQNKDHEGQNKS
jgi:hypothetical protein